MISQDLRRRGGRKLDWPGSDPATPIKAPPSSLRHTDVVFASDEEADLQAVPAGPDSAALVTGLQLPHDVAPVPVRSAARVAR
jgi:hypothetical protein